MENGQTLVQTANLGQRFDDVVSDMLMQPQYLRVELIIAAFAARQAERQADAMEQLVAEFAQWVASHETDHAMSIEEQAELEGLVNGR